MEYHVVTVYLYNGISCSFKLCLFNIKSNSLYSAMRERQETKIHTWDKLIFTVLQLYTKILTVAISEW